MSQSQQADKVTPAQKKALVMSTQAYKEWWAARQSQSPIPSDPYRAFMIDIGLRAIRTRRQIWEHNTNRTDITEVDFPTGYHQRPLKPREIPRKQEHRKPRYPPYVKPQRALSPLEQEVQRRTREFAEKLRVPTPRVYVGSGVLQSTYQSGWGSRRSAFGESLGRVQVSEPNIFLGASQKSKAQTLAALYHELGHHAHAYSHYSETGGLSSHYLSSARLEKEREAWKIADPFLKEGRPIQKWVKRYVLGGYAGQNINTSRRKKS